MRAAFRYRSRGNLATIGRAEAVVATRYFARHGMLAWVLWWDVEPIIAPSTNTRAQLHIRACGHVAYVRAWV